VRHSQLSGWFALALLLTCSASGASLAPTPSNISIGKDLQTYATVALSEPASGDFQLTLTSTDPKRLLLAKQPDAVGSGSITLTVKARFRESPEFWLQSLADTGTVRYVASAPGFAETTATATLTPSGVTIVGPWGASAPPEFTTTPRAWPTKLTLRAMRLDDALQCVEPQYVRGGVSLDVHLKSSDAKAGSPDPAIVKIPAVTDTAIVQFKPAGIGKATISLAASPSLKVPATQNAVFATVKQAGMAVADDLILGQHLQLPVALSLGEPAPEGGVTVTLTSADPKNLILSTDPNEVGKESLEIRIPAGTVTVPYYLQALGRSGAVSHTATASGYSSRTGTITLAPSGVILSLDKHGPPDRAEIARPETAGGKRTAFVSLLSDPSPSKLIVYTAYLDPATRRCADITVQPLRAGLSVELDLTNSDPAIGTADRKVVIKGGSDHGLASFKPIKGGETVISVSTPPGFLTPSNFIELLAIVR
jgi:hypothetical protein